MSDPKVLLLESSLEDILSKGGVPLEELPLSADEKVALRAEADARLSPGGSSGHWVCFRVTPDTSICHWVVDLKPKEQ